MLVAERILNLTCIITPLSLAPSTEAAVKATFPVVLFTSQVYSAPKIWMLFWDTSWMLTNSNAVLSYVRTNWMESMV